MPNTTTKNDPMEVKLYLFRVQKQSAREAFTSRLTPDSPDYKYHCKYQCHMKSSFSNHGSDFGFFELPVLPEWMVNSVAGFGDAIFATFTLGFLELEDIRKMLGSGDTVNRNSNAYFNASIGGYAYAMLLPFAPKGAAPAKSGATATRSSLAQWWYRGSENDTAWRALTFMEKVYFDIGQKSMVGKKYLKYEHFGNSVAGIVARGKGIVVNEKWLKAIVSEVPGLVLGAGSTLRTGPTPSVRYALPRLPVSVAVIFTILNRRNGE
ncbi:hypothetical protein AGMMS49545_11750 [Betaproteobacteria bacterium]|nr:hypothetical protein AGMMS49545_11750 [Betaproteobacteria bacterium]